MNKHRILRFSMTEQMIVIFILLTAGGTALLMAVVWQLILVPRGQVPSQAGPWKIVNDFHVAVNSNNADDVLALFSDSATIADNQSLINDRYQIRNWILHSNQMAGLHLKMFHSEMDGEKLIWLDTAYNGSEGKNRYYILRWEAVIAEGKIQTLVVMSRYMPDLK